MTDYRQFRLSKLNDPTFSHLKLLLYWPIYGLVFLTLERFLHLDYHTIYTPLDDLVPFCEYFLFPYLYWFVFLIGMHLYLLLFDTAGFRKFMWFIILTYTATCIIYLIYPRSQEAIDAGTETDGKILQGAKVSIVFGQAFNVQFHGLTPVSVWWEWPR